MRRVEAEDPEGAKSFRSVLEVLEGHRVAMDGRSFKALRLVLEHGEGCDGWITRAAFEIRYGWHRSRRPDSLFLSTAPAVVSQLLLLADVQGPTRRVRAVLGPAEATLEGGPSWSFGRRFLWFDASEDGVEFRVREAAPGASVPEALPNAIPEFVARPNVMLELAQPFACPHCRRELTTYRELRNEVWICVSCGRSFELGASSRPPPGARRPPG